MLTIGSKGIAAAIAVTVALTVPVWAQSSRLEGLKLSGDQPINIESDRLEVRENDKVAVFTGNVNATQGATLLKAGTLTVYYGGEGAAATGTADIRRIEVAGKVYVKSNKQVATGDRGSFDMQSEVLVLSGNEVVLSEGQNVLVGCELVVNMKTGQARVNSCKNGGGRVKMLVDPNSTNRP